jgi:hypothetical protein
MKAVFKSSYPKAGNEIFVFTCKGTAQEIEQYLADNAQAVTDEVTGLPLYFTAYPTLNYADKAGIELYRSRAGKYSLDNSEMRRSQALAKAFKAEAEFATAVVTQITGNLFGRRTTSSVVTAASVIADEAVADEEVTEVADEADLDNI